MLKSINSTVCLKFLNIKYWKKVDDQKWNCVRASFPYVKMRPSSTDLGF